MSKFKLTFACVLVTHVIAGYALAADHDVSSDGVITADITFTGTDTVLANTANSFNPGTTANFTNDSVLIVSAANAISAGVQNFKDNSYLQITVADAISGGRQNFFDNSHIELVGVDLVNENLAFNLADANTKLSLSGQKALLGLLEGKGRVVNDSNQDGTLTLDTGKWRTSTFDGVLADGTGSGKLNLIKQGFGEWIYNGDGSGMTGTTTVNDGQLTVNGDLSNSSVTVNAGGTLSGTGTVGSVAVKAAGMLGAERAGDRLKINGDLDMAKLSTFYVAAGPDGKAGLVEVKGTAGIEGAVVYVAAGGGHYAPNTLYSILTADGGVDGKFLAVSTNLYFLKPKLIYNADSVDLELERNDKSIVSVARSRSSINVANSLGAHTNTLVNHLLSTDHETASLALEQLAGAASASRVAAMLASTTQVSNTLLRAMEQRDNRGNSLQPAVLHSDAPLLVSNDHGPHDPRSEGRVWVKALGSQGVFESENSAGDLRQRTTGGLLGADWPVGDAWRMGVVSGYSKTDLDGGDYLSGAMKSYHLGAYAWHHYGPLATRLGLAYSNHEGSSKRQVDYNHFSDTPRGHFDASGQQVFVELAYQSANGRLVKEPFINLSYQRYQRDAYAEKGGAASLHVEEQAQNNLTSTLGLRVASLRQLDNGMSLTPRGAIGWRHTYGETEISARQRFISGGSAFDVYGSNLDRDSMMLEGGLDLGLSRSQSVGLGYTGEVGSNGRNHGWQAQWRLSF
jgi:outer membrane autotransporter protein